MDANTAYALGRVSSALMKDGLSLDQTNILEDGEPVVTVARIDYRLELVKYEGPF
jgi:hypothetical protein